MVLVDVVGLFSKAHVVLWLCEDEPANNKETNQSSYFLLCSMAAYSTGILWHDFDNCILLLLKTESHYNANSVIAGSTVGCFNDNLRGHK